LETTLSAEKGLAPATSTSTASSGVSRGHLSGLINRYKTEANDGVFASFLSEFDGLLNYWGIVSLIGVYMSF
jgi:hypothetical protein